MNKAEFLAELRSKLINLPQAEIEKTIAFYDESIDDRIEDGETEQEAVEGLGNLDDIVEGIMLDTPLPALIQSKIKKSRSNFKSKKLWIILAICGCPLWIPLLIAFLAVILAFYICIWAVIISIFAMVAAFGAAGVGGLFGGIMVMITNNPYTGLAVLGMAVMLAGLFIMAVKPSVWLCKKLIIFTGTALKWLKRKLFVKKEAKAAL